mmetsp:Transcript_18094/g.26775  ORF Transcript_18094/g.26775 Transcript_18094/m.26775 type:complete len:87 (+) Transcript_18094:379-639(+)
MCEEVGRSLLTSLVVTMEVSSGLRPLFCLQGVVFRAISNRSNVFDNNIDCSRSCVTIEASYRMEGRKSKREALRNKLFQGKRTFKR